MKLNLTEKFVQEYVVPEGKKQDVLLDFELPRFGVSVTARGIKSYVISYRDTQGKQRQEKVADFSAMSLPAARALAATRLQAIDALKQGMSRRRSSCPTMDTFFFKTFLPLVKTQSRSYETHASIYRNHLQQVFGGLRLDDITEEVVLDFNSSLATKRVAFKNAGVNGHYF